MQWPTAERKIREQQRCSIRPAAVDLVSMVLGFDYNRDLPSVLIQVVYNIAYALLTVPVVVIFVASHFGMHLQLKERLKRVAENMLLLVLSFGVWVGCSAFVLLFPILKDAIRGSKYELRTAFPARVLTEPSRTLEALGLAPSATLCVRLAGQ